MLGRGCGEDSSNDYYSGVQYSAKNNLYGATIIVTPSILATHACNAMPRERHGSVLTVPHSFSSLTDDD